MEMREYLTCEEVIKKSVDEFSKTQSLSDDLSLYHLRIANKDGSPDMDFPSKPIYLRNQA